MYINIYLVYMKNIDSFLVNVPKEEKPLEFSEIIKKEMGEDILAFPSECQPVIEKFINGDELSQEEDDILNQERETWWFDKYGFSYKSKEPRKDVLRLKYNTSEKDKETHDLQNDLLQAFGNSKGEINKDVESIRTTYEEKYSTQLEGVESLFELAPFLLLSKKINNKEISNKDERKKAYEELTEYQFLLTHFISLNSHDKDFLNIFWDTARGIAEKTGCLKEFNITRRGIITQVATYKIFEELGENPKLSHPKEDAFQSIDLWTDENHAVQVKSSYENDVKIVETDEITFPGVQIEEDSKIRQFSSNHFQEAQKFKAKVKDYEKTSNKKLDGYFIVIPYSKVDFITGEPSKELVEFVKNYLKAKE